MVENQQKKKTVISRDFDLVYANGFRVRLGDNDGSITFLVDTDDENATTYLMERIQILMTPRVMKMLQMALTDAVSNLEKAIGTPISLPHNLTFKVERK